MKLLEIVSARYHYIPGWYDLQVKIDPQDGSLPGVHQFNYDPGDNFGLSPQVRDALPSWLETNTVKPISTPTVDLLDYSANVRFRIETGGTPVLGNVIATDRQSQAMITGAFSYVSQNPSTVISFKTTTGWIQANSQLIVLVANAVGTHVQSCFSAEQEVDSKISSGQIIDKAGVDQYYAGLGLGTGFNLDGVGYSPGRTSFDFMSDSLFDSSFDVSTESGTDFMTSTLSTSTGTSLGSDLVQGVPA